MTKETIYGFVLDSAARLKSNLDTPSGADQGIGVLVGESYNYLINKTRLTDNRVSRLTTADDKSIVGSLEIIYDKDRVPSKSIPNLTNAQQSAVFAILERIYTQDMDSQEQIETILTTDESYTGYVPGSYFTSTEYVTARLNLSDGTARLFKFANWIEFEFTTNEVDLVFHLWISNKAFSTQYPYVTITSVIAPYDLTVLTDPATLIQQGIFSILQNSPAYVFSKTNVETMLRDQNGIYTFNTTYVVDGRTSITIPFALAYCGAKTPSSLDCRAAIRNYLESNTELSPDDLKILFPDVYVNCRFYIVPIYDKYTSRAGKDYYPSVWNLSALEDIARKVYGNYTEEFRKTYLEALTNAQSKMLLLVLPDPNNNELFSVRKAHPTYQDYSSQEAGFKYMDGTTQEFSIKLNEAMAIVNGVAATGRYQQTESGGSTYLVFAQDTAEYLVMTRDSYESIVDNT